MTLMLQAPEIIKGAPFDQGATAVIIYCFVVALILGAFAIGAVAVWVAVKLVPALLDRVDKLIAAMNHGFEKIDNTIKSSEHERNDEFREWRRDQDMRLAKFEERQMRTLIIIEDLSPSGKLKSDSILGRQP